MKSDTQSVEFGVSKVLLCGPVDMGHVIVLCPVFYSLCTVIDCDPLNVLGLRYMTWSWKCVEVVLWWSGA